MTSLLRAALAMILVLAVMPEVMAEQSGGTISSTDAASSLPGTPPKKCANIPKITCPDCTVCQLPSPADPNQSGAKGQSGGTGYTGCPLVDELSFNHVYYVDDYIHGSTGGGGCTSCGSAPSALLDGGAGLFDLGWRRTHRYRDMSQRSSFGPGVYATYDVSLSIARNDSGSWQAILTDPALLAPMIMTDSGGGLFKGAGWNKIQGLRFYTGTGGSGSTVADPSLAGSAVLTTFPGYQYVFDLFNPYGTLPAPWKYGDIGNTASHGEAGTANGVFTMSTGGSDIWNTADSFGYVYQAIQGDATITARVDAFTTYRGLAAESTNINAKAGVMLRETLDAGSTDVNLSVSHAGLEYISRTASGISAVQDAFQSGVFAPRWLRLQRVGNVITGSVSTDGTTWSVVTSKTVAMASTIFVGLSATAHDAAGAISDARFSSVALTGSPVAPASWPVPVTVPFTSPVLAGRLASITDRNGYALRIAYKTWTPAQLLQSPDLPWQMDTVTDPHGRKLTISYGAAQVAGRWAVSSVTLPDSAVIAYTYTNGLLSGVGFPDSTASTITATPDSATNCTIIAYDDAAAPAPHRRKKAYLTNIFSIAIDNRNPYQVYNQSSNLVRMILDGAGDVKFLSYSVDTLTSIFYEGGIVKEITKLSSAMQISYFTSWTFSTTTGLSGTAEPSSVLLQYGSENLYRQDSPSTVTDERGVVKTFINDSDGYPQTVTYSDGTTEAYTYNGFKQVTRYQDRLKRVTVTSYDTRGNETLKEVGILFNGTSDVHQTEYATYQKQYFAAGDANQFLLKAEIDANGNTTSYAYTPVSANGDNHFVKTITTPADAGTGTIAAWTFGYDTSGRRISSMDAVGRTTQYGYDARDRLTRTTYADNSTEVIVYSTTATDKNLISMRKDRQGTVTEYFYDLAGRTTVTRIGNRTMSADGSSVTPIDPTLRGQESLQTQVLQAYLPGTLLESERWENGILTNGDAAPGATVVVTAAGVASGNRTTSTYDYRQRLASRTRWTTATIGLTSTWTYTNNLLSQVADPYGRKGYPVYRPSDARQIRQVLGLISADTVGTTAATITRDTSINPKYLITDFQLDAEGQRIGVVDPRTITSTMTYDSRGRLTSSTEASSDSTVSGRTDYLYDAQSNQTEVRTPRYFISLDTAGYQKDSVTNTYTHRNLVQSKTAALGVSGVAGTVFYTYTDDGRRATTTNENGNLARTIWKVCCARVDSQVDPQATDIAGQFFGTRFLDYTNYGDQTHEAMTRGTIGNPAPGCCNQDPVDALTLTEATMAYDVRHRRIARTQWFAPLAAVDPNNPPIAGQNGISASQGLTTVIRYDDNLADSQGLSNPSDVQSVATYLSGLGLGANAPGSALVTINPAGEPRWTIMDGLGRVVRVVDGNGHASTTTYDVVDGTTTLVKTTVTDALGHASSQYADAAGRVRIQEDQLPKRTTLGFDADGNLVSQRDPTGIGQDFVYDSRNRRTQWTDTASPPVVITTSYDANSNTASTTDGLGHVVTMTYDARDRKVTALDRVSGTTTFAYDAHSNLLRITDADGSITSYLYDPRELLSTETYPAGSATPNSPTTPPLDVRSYLYDAARRLLTRTDQANVVTTFVYDFISRLTARQYSSGLGNDTFGYDAANRLTAAISGRYGTGITRSYMLSGEKAGLLRSETQIVSGIGLSVGYAYDAANRTVGINYPDGSLVARTYTNRNQLASAQIGSSTIASGISYDDAGRRTSLPLGNGLTESRTYYGDGLVHTITEGTANAVENLTYVYDANKRVTSETNGLSANDTQGFGYDNEDRVTSWTTALTSQSWVLSKVGDWTSTVRSGTGAFTQGRTPWQVHEINTIQQSPPPVGVPSTPVSELSDAKGNLKVDAFGLQGYQWDDENRLTTASVLASGTNVRQGDLGTYLYDPLGRRLQKRVGNVITTYVHDGAQVVAEYESPTFVSQTVGIATAGSLSISNGTISLAGSGADIWGTADAFQYAAQSFVGDGTITVQATGLTNTDPWAKAGIMIRADSTAGAANALIAVTPGNGVAFQARTTAGVSTTNAVATGRTVPIWLRLTKSGTTFTGQYSTDAVNWTTVGTATISMTLPATAGLAVTAHNASATATATFLNYGHTAQVTTSGSQTLVRRYVYGTYVDEPLALVSGSTTSYYASNRLYSVVALTNSLGAVTERYRYDTYGMRTVLTPTSTPVVGNVSAAGNQIGFTGRYLDPETGLWYFRTRYENATLGRFINRMPWERLQYQYTSNYSFDAVPSDIANFMINSMNEGFSSYQMGRLNLYDFMKGSPANYTEPFSGPLCGGAIGAAAAPVVAPVVAEGVFWLLVTIGVYEVDVVIVDSIPKTPPPPDDPWYKDPKAPKEPKIPPKPKPQDTTDPVPPQQPPKPPKDTTDDEDSPTHACTFECSCCPPKMLSLTRFGYRGPCPYFFETYCPGTDKKITCYLKGAKR